MAKRGRPLKRASSTVIEGKPFNSEAKIDEDGITPHERLFIVEYVTNGKFAWQAMHAVTPHLSVASAKIQAHRVLTKPEVQRVLSRYAKEVATNYNQRVARFIQEAERVAYSNIKNVLLPGNKTADITQLEDDITAAVESVTTTTTHRMSGRGEITTEQNSIKLHSKTQALTILGKVLGVLDNEVGPNGDEVLDRNRAERLARIDELQKKTLGGQ